MPNRYEKGSFAEPPSSEAHEDRFERLEDIPFRPGDTLITRGSRMRVDEVAFNVEQRDGRGYAEFSEKRFNGDKAVIRVPFRELARFDDIVTKIERHEQIPEPLALQMPKEVWRRFEKLDIRAGDTIHSKSGTRRVINEIRYNLSEYGGRLAVERIDKKGHAEEGYLLMSEVTYNPKWVEAIERSRTEDDEDTPKRPFEN